MRIFLAGATGVIGSALVPILVDAGHAVAGMTRTAAKAGHLAALGIHPVLCDVFDLPALTSAVRAFAPDLVMHQLTDLPDDASRIAAHLEGHARVRTEGTRNLLSAAAAAGAPRFLAQSIAWQGPPAVGVDPVAELERAVLDDGGVVLRYGQFTGPGTYFEAGPPPHPRISVDDAARRTVDLLDAPSGIYVLTGP